MNTDTKRVDFLNKVRIPEGGLKVGRFLLHLLEMQIPMGLGMAIFGLLVQQFRTSPSYAATFQSGTDLYIIGDGLFMTVPMVAWMVFRGHGWRHSVEMGAAMLAPGIAIIVLGWLGAFAYLPWLTKLACTAMCLGMVVAMLYRWDHFTAKAGHLAHTAHAEGEASGHAGGQRRSEYSNR